MPSCGRLRARGEGGGKENEVCGRKQLLRGASPGVMLPHTSQSAITYLLAEILVVADLDVEVAVNGDIAALHPAAPTARRRTREARASEPAVALTSIVAVSQPLR